MKLVVFDYNKELGLEHEIKYLDRHDIKERGVDAVIQEIKDFQPDAIIEREFNDGASDYSKIYKKLPEIPKAWWCIDAHTNLINHIVYAKQFDYIFCAQSWFVPLFQNQVKAQIYWLPLSHTQSLSQLTARLAKEAPARDIEFSFVGNIRSIHVERQAMVMNFIEQMGDKFLPVIANNYEDMLTLLQRSQMTFNCSLNEDLNLRVWEALAMDTPIMTDYVCDITAINGLAQRLKVIYPRTTETRLTEIINNAPYPDKTSKWVLDGHTLTHRYNHLIWMLLTRKQMDF